MITGNLIWLACLEVKLFKTKFLNSKQIIFEVIAGCAGVWRDFNGDLNQFQRGIFSDVKSHMYANLES